MEPNHQPDVLGTVPKPYLLMAPPPISLSMPRDGDSTSPLCSLPQYCRWGWKASSNNSSTGSHPTSGETGAQPRERNPLFSSFPCVSSISWTAKLRNGGKKKVQEFLPLHSQAVGLVSSWQWCSRTEQGPWGYDSQRKKSVSDCMQQKVSMLCGA